MCKRFWRTSPFPNIAFCRVKEKDIRIHTHTHTKQFRDLEVSVTWCAFPSVSRAVVRGGLRNGRLV